MDAVLIGHLIRDEKLLEISAKGGVQPKEAQACVSKFGLQNSHVAQHNVSKINKFVYHCIVIYIYISIYIRNIDKSLPVHIDLARDLSHFRGRHPHGGRIVEKHTHGVSRFDPTWPLTAIQNP